MRHLWFLLVFLLWATTSQAWLGGFGGGSGGGGGGITGSGISGRLTLWTGASTVSSALITSASGETQFLDNTLSLRLRIFMDGTPDPVIRPVSSTLRFQEPGGNDVITIENALPAILNDGAMLIPIAAVSVHATRDTIFKDTADGEIKVRKSTADGGGLVSLESGGLSAQFDEDVFIPTLGQTIFTLSTAHVGATGSSFVCINTACGYELTTDYTISGTALTWQDAAFTLDTSDRLVVKHQTN